MDLEEVMSQANHSIPRVNYNCKVYKKIQNFVDSIYCLKKIYQSQVQWQHRSLHQDFLSLDQGEIVIAREYHNRMTYEVKGAAREIQNVVTVERLHHRKTCKNKGFISIDYLQFLSSTGLPKTTVGRAILSTYDIPREILECRWFVGCINPVEIGIWLRNDLQSSFGSYLVCQPSEIISHVAGWPNYVLVVKCLTEMGELCHEWEENQEHNVSRTFSPVYPVQAIRTDTISHTSQPLTSIAYIRIKRTTDSVYFVILQDNSVETSFQTGGSRKSKRNIAEQKSMRNMNASLALGYPAEYHANPILGPEPMEIPVSPTFCQESKHTNGLIMVSDKKVIHYKINIISEIATKRKTFAGKTYRAILSSEGRYNEVAFKRLKKSYYQEELFEKCLDLLHVGHRQYATEFSSAAKNIPYRIQGEDYICKIAGFSTNDKMYGPWVAYEFVSGNSLDVALVMRKKDGLPPLTNRANFEIMYQIAAGMRYLENNGLCHRDLRAANILVYVQHQYSMAIKITDYMLTLSILSKLPENSDLSSLHWRWMDYEALEYRQFGIKTDIWSFGCVIFEILNPGKLPYSLEKIPIENPQGYFSG
ncbi:unnamed protein product [Brugia pahangi]|uniref:Protein kinase domain-containing protein n=1 Tax=Brugia pahangi TaxID=6280 RepID=A0A0N4TR91_BRUPA|nr:unnamed protein product [Brugia pahangi]